MQKILRNRLALFHSKRLTRPFRSHKYSGMSILKAKELLPLLFHFGVLHSETHFFGSISFYMLTVSDNPDYVCFMYWYVYINF